ncbi:MAG: histidine--tRNA ligase [Thermoplasmatales archaeon]|nr:histidine--tRNA ligase [Thermoplasmatales archaeon]
MAQRPRGTRDFLPDEMERRRHYEGVLRRRAETFGFREISTPIFEETELFVARSGPNIVEELYAFEDKGGRGISLRPELTAPAIRLYVNGMSNDPKPVKAFYFGQCFRYERPQSGRYREFFQFGAELIGGSGPESDAEVIALAAAMVRDLGLKNYKVRLGHIGVLRDRLASVGIPGDGMAEILQKLDKKAFDEARPILESRGVGDADIESIFGLVSTVGGPEVLSAVPGEIGEYMGRVLALLDAMGVGDVEVDLGVVRGLDYYTGIVFEMEAPALGAEKQICGGGSYALAEVFGGEPVFTTGFAIGFDRILLAMEKEGLEHPRKALRAYIVPVSDDVRVEAARIVASLRDAGISADIDLMDRKMGRALKHASSVGAEKAVIVGAKELSQGVATVRDMESGEQSEVPLDCLVDHFLS